MGSDQIFQWKEGSKLVEKFWINLSPESDPSLKEILANIPQTSFDLISKMLHLNPNERISLKDVLKHSFFTCKSRLIFQTIIKL